MEESRRDDRLCVLVNFKGFEHTMDNLKSMVRNQSQWIKNMDIECQYMTYLVHPQHSFLASINEG